METPVSLSPNILTAAEHLADVLSQASPVAEYLQAQANLHADPEATDLLNRYAQLQAQIRRSQSLNGVKQEDIDVLRDLQQQVQDNHTIMEYAETQHQAIAFLPLVNQEISQLLGADFATLARSCSC